MTGKDIVPFSEIKKGQFVASVASAVGVHGDEVTIESAKQDTSGFWKDRVIVKFKILSPSVQMAKSIGSIMSASSFPDLFTSMMANQGLSMAPSDFKIGSAVAHTLVQKQTAEQSEESTMLAQFSILGLVFLSLLSICHIIRQNSSFDDGSGVLVMPQDEDQALISGKRSSLSYSKLAPSDDEDDVEDNDDRPYFDSTGREDYVESSNARGSIVSGSIEELDDV